MEEYEIGILKEITNKERYLAVISSCEENIDFIKTHNLEYSKWTPQNPTETIVVAPKIKIREAITKDKIKSINLVRYEEAIFNILSKMENFDIIECVIKLQEYFIKEDYKSPEIDIMYGVLFGYKPCDIKYYVQTRDEGQERHHYEEILDKKIGSRTRTLYEQHIMCEKCTIKHLEELD